MAPGSRSRRSTEYCFIPTVSHHPNFSATRSNVIVHEASAAVEGTMTINEAGVTKRYAFCDVYRLSGSETGQIEEISTYMIELDPGGAS